MLKRKREGKPKGKCERRPENVRTARSIWRSDDQCELFAGRPGLSRPAVRRLNEFHGELHDELHHTLYVALHEQPVERTVFVDHGELSVRQVRKRFLKVQLSAEAQVRAHQPAAARVRDLHKALQTQAPSDRAQATAYRREAVPMRGQY